MYVCVCSEIQTVPLLAFERWRFASKWAEDVGASLQQKQGEGEKGKSKGKAPELGGVIPYGEGVEVTADVCVCLVWMCVVWVGVFCLGVRVRVGVSACILNVRVSSLVFFTCGGVQAE